MRSMIALATPAGAKSPLRLPAIIPGSPASIAVGMSGAALMRGVALDARVRTLPARWKAGGRPAQVGRHKGNVTGGEVGDAGCRAFVGNVHDVGRADELLEQFARQIGQRAGASRAVGQLAWIGPGVGNELLEIARGHGFVDHDRGRRVAENIDSDEILERIVGRVVHDRGNEHLRAGIAEQEGVTVRLRARATSVAPVTPPPPPRFSVTTVPRNGFIFSAHSRPTTSVAPPGENGTTSLMARSG